MKKVLPLLLAFCFIYSNAKGHDVEKELTPLKINQLFDDKNIIDISTVPDFILKSEKIDSCVSDYVAKQTKSYSKIAQSTLYDLIHNFDRILSRIYGNKLEEEDIPYTAKLEILARIQCEAYYEMGALK